MKFVHPSCKTHLLPVASNAYRTFPLLILAGVGCTAHLSWLLLLQYVYSHHVYGYLHQVYGYIMGILYSDHVWVFTVWVFTPCILVYIHTMYIILVYIHTMYIGLYSHHVHGFIFTPCIWVYIHTMYMGFTLCMWVYYIDIMYCIWGCTFTALLLQIFLDVADVTRYFPHVTKYLKFGKTVAVYSPRYNTILWWSYTFFV